MVLGIGEVIAIKQAEKTHESELGEQKRAIDGLKEDVHKAEMARQIDTAYLKAKLEDANQGNTKYNEALMKIARVSEENIRKQYETKVLSNNQLRDFTADVVKRMRALSYKYKQISDQHSNTWQAQELQAARSGDHAKMQQLYNQEMQEYTQQHTNLEYEFKSTILGDAIYARDELQHRIGPPQPSLLFTMASGAFQGILAGPDPVGDAAAYLESLAKQLSP
jgi:hypothetical protein